MIERDRILLLDMLKYARRARRHLAGLSAAELEQDELRYDGVVRALSVVGEAAHNLSDAAKADMAEVPWAQIRGMRNILVHNYDGIDAEVLAAAVVDSLPELEAVLVSRLGPAA